jgi:hypothetical protein
MAEGNRKVDLEKEIQDASNRINKKSYKNQIQIESLEKQIKKFSGWAWGFVIGGFIVGVIGVLSYFCGEIKEYNLNLLGDFFGGTVASLWSLAGLFFIYVAFLGQRQQLLHQQLEIMYSQLEIKYTRIELEGQKKEMIKQNETLRQQRFENTFFQLLSTHNSIVNSIDLRNKTTGNITSSGRDCFESFYKRMKSLMRYLDHSLTGQNINLEEAPFDKTMRGYLNFYEEKQSDLGHYFGNLYQLFLFVKSSSIENKKTYSEIVRAQLSSYELTLLFYHCLSDYGREQFKPIVEEFSILKNLDFTSIFNNAHLSKYAAKAFEMDKTK